MVARSEIAAVLTPGTHGSTFGGNPVACAAALGVLDALEQEYPVLRGTIRDRATGKRRAFIRFYACERDLSNEAPDTPLPDAVAARIASGDEPFMVVGAMAGG